MWIVRFALQRPYTFVIVVVLIAIFGISAILNTQPTFCRTLLFQSLASSGPTAGWMRTTCPANHCVCERALPTTVQHSIHGIATYRGVGVIKIYFQPGVQVDLAIAQVTALAQSLLRLMPPGILPSYVLKYDASRFLSCR